MTATPAGIILVHGYSGSCHDLDFLSSVLAERYGSAAVVKVSLPGHDTADMPSFNAEAFLDTIAGHIERFIGEGRPVVLIGHSTGGSFLLRHILQSGYPPLLLILAGTPKRIDTTWFERWASHRRKEAPLPFVSVAKMISFVNKAGKEYFDTLFPVHLLQGEKDTLVPADEATLWEKETFAGPVSRAVVSDGGHDIFQGTGKEEAARSVLQAIDDVCGHDKIGDEEFLARLTASEPEAKRFFDGSPRSLACVAASPSGRTFVSCKPGLSSFALSPPVIANIELTTRCMLRCPHCARSFLAREEEDMTAEAFEAILEKLPYAYRVNFVGLGEPLMHPAIVDFTAKASSQGRRVGLVTNGMLLDGNLSENLIDAGLASIAFSLDSTEPSVVSQVRKGSDLPLILDNIKTFMSKTGRSDAVSTAIFAAVSTKTAPYLKTLLDCAKGLGVHVVMLTDLNFKENTGKTIRQNKNSGIEKTVRDAVAHAFSQGLPVLSVHGLEEFGLRQRYREFLLMPPGALYDRSPSRTWCYSPWQTVPVDVAGNVTLCDCRPDKSVGNLLTEPSFEHIWNGEAMRAHRKKMLSETPPEACGICPRF